AAATPDPPSRSDADEIPSRTYLPTSVEMSCHEDLGVMELADGLLDALAGRSRQAPARVAAWMVLGAVFITSASDEEVAPDEVLRAEMIRSALRTLDHTLS
ncbi:hypothetical protein ABT329_40785, partial [Streptomyces minutiscleroticus]